MACGPTVFRALQAGQTDRHPCALTSPWREARWARRRLDDGDQLGSLAAALDVHRETLRRWVSAPAVAASTTVALVPVEISDGEAAGPGPAPISVVSPTGYRIDGLTLAEAITVLARLR